MTTQKPPRPTNRVREALGKLYDQEPPYFREYLRRFKEDPSSRVFAPLADAYRRQGRLEEAISICLEGLGHHPEFHGGRLALAKCYLDKKAYKEAREALERVVHAAPENLLAQRLLGDACLGLDDTKGALHALRMALLLSPNDVALSGRVHELERALGTSREVIEPSGEPMGMGAERASGEESWGMPMAPDGVGELVAPADGSLRGDGLPGTPSAGAGDSAAPFDLEALLGADEDPARRDDDSFRIEHVSSIFNDEGDDHREITTSTLGDLYFSQGQFDRALRIFEKIAAHRASPEIQRKIHLCRVRLGVDERTLLRNRKIETLRSILRRVRSE